MSLGEFMETTYQIFMSSFQQIVQAIQDNFWNQLYENSLKNFIYALML